MTSLLLQDANSQYWAVSVDDLGGLHADSAAPGALSNGYINDAGLTTSWQIRVTIDGGVIAWPVAFNAGYPTALLLVSPGNLNFNLTVTVDGVLIASSAAGVVYEVAAGTLAVTMGETPAVWTARQGAMTLPVTIGEQAASALNAVGNTTLSVHPTMTPASLANAFSAASFAAMLGVATLSALATATYDKATSLAFTAGLSAPQSKLDAVAAAALSATMGLQETGLKNVTSTASLAAMLGMTPSSTWNVSSSASIAAGLGFSTLSAIAGATYDKATSLSFTAGLAAPQPRKDAAGPATLALTLSESAASQASRLAGATLPIIPGLTSAGALPAGAVVTLSTLFGFSADGVKNLATVVESVRLLASKIGAALEASKDATVLDARKDDDKLEAEL